MKSSIRACYILAFIFLTACSSNQGNKGESRVDSAAPDSSMLDTPMSTGTGSDTIQEKLKEGEDGTGKPSTDPRTRKQQ
jgi:hypothetical protein